MKKIVFLLVLVLLFTGCSLNNINDADINSIIDNAIEEKNIDERLIFSGYKLRIPQGYKIVGKNGNNYKMMSNTDNYYLYVDIISRYHKKEIIHEFDRNSYFAKEISYKDITGFIEIKEVENKYYIVAEYNYAKMETVIDKDNLKTSVRDIIKILSSVEYNDLIINSLIGENALNYKEEEFNLFESKKEENYFMDYVEEYDTYKDDTPVDEDIIN